MNCLTPTLPRGQAPLTAAGPRTVLDRLRCLAAHFSLHLGRLARRWFVPVPRAPVRIDLRW